MICEFECRISPGAKFLFNIRVHQSWSAYFGDRDRRDRDCVTGRVRAGTIGSYRNRSGHDFSDLVAADGSVRSFWSLAFWRKDSAFERDAVGLM